MTRNFTCSHWSWRRASVMWSRNPIDLYFLSVSFLFLSLCPFSMSFHFSPLTLSAYSFRSFSLWPFSFSLFICPLSLVYLSLSSLHLSLSVFSLLSLCSLFLCHLSLSFLSVLSLCLFSLILGRSVCLSDEKEWWKSRDNGLRRLKTNDRRGGSMICYSYYY